MGRQRTLVQEQLRRTCLFIDCGSGYLYPWGDGHGLLCKVCVVQLAKTWILEDTLCAYSGFKVSGEAERNFIRLNEE